MVGITEDAADVTLRAIYASVLELGTPYITTDLATAELVKVAANAFLATKISFINAVANVCDAAGADVMTLADALGHDTRIGRRFLSAGLGFGGGCLSKDIRAFMARADELGVGDSLQFLREVDQINTGRRALAVEAARELAGGSFAGRNVAVLGAAFKPDTDDVRDSPALEVARTIQLRGRGGAGARPAGHLQRPPRLAGPGLRRGSGQGLRGGGRGAAPHRVARVPRDRPGRAGFGGPDAVPARRAQRAPPGRVAGGGWTVRSLGGAIR